MVKHIDLGLKNSDKKEIQQMCCICAHKHLVVLDISAIRQNEIIKLGIAV